MLLNYWPIANQFSSSEYQNIKDLFYRALIKSPHIFDSLVTNLLFFLINTSPNLFIKLKYVHHHILRAGA